MNGYQKALAQRKEEHLLRSLPLPPEGIDFFSNDYLGFASSSGLQLCIEKEFRKAPEQNGATGSRLLSGNSTYAEDVEKQVADFHRAEAALIYPNGYMANLGLISSLATHETTLLCDELIHASLIDGARLGKAKRIRFSHNDIDDLSEKLQKTAGQKVVIVESIYSMDGDICPLESMVKVCKKHDAMLVVDEAHSMGIYGKNGEGLVQKLGLGNDVLARIMTYGKAPGIHGASVVGPAWLRDYQINFSRSMIFSTAPAIHQFASISGMYVHLPKANTLRNQLKEVIDYFLKKRKNHSGEWLLSQTHIQSLIIPGNEAVVKAAGELRQKGINALPIRKPSVSEGTERIRFCLHAHNTQEEIDLLFDHLN